MLPIILGAAALFGAGYLVGKSKKTTVVVEKKIIIKPETKAQEAKPQRDWIRPVEQAKPVERVIERVTVVEVEKKPRRPSDLEVMMAGALLAGGARTPTTPWAAERPERNPFDVLGLEEDETDDLVGPTRKLGGYDISHSEGPLRSLAMTGKL